MPSAISGRSSGTYFKGYIEGGPELAKRLQALEKAVRDDLLVEATRAGAEVIAERWRAMVMGVWGLGPGTAHYAEAIEVRARPGRNGATAHIGIGDVPLSEGEANPRDYAPKLEFAGRPTLRPAFDQGRQPALDRMAEVIRTLLEAVAPLEPG
jgi:hypothetical protein